MKKGEIMKEKIEIRKGSEKAWLVRGANFDEWDIPIIETAVGTPTSLLPFSKCKKERDFAHWIHFYEQDDKFENLWTNPKGHVEKLKRFNGIISPDFSIYADYPLAEQVHNKYRNHAVAYWLSTQGIPVIPNVRWSNERSYDFCFRGIEKNSVVAVGTHGQMKSKANRELFTRGLPVMISTLSPHTIIVYGNAPDDVFGKYKTQDMKIIVFKSETARYHERKKGVA